MKITEAAEKKLKEVLAKENNENLKVRVFVNGVG
ncbi:Fe-S cluster assembly iron-binding protein IscA [Desulfitispora alkaliphila]